MYIYLLYVKLKKKKKVHHNCPSDLTTFTSAASCVMIPKGVFKTSV